MRSFIAMVLLVTCAACSSAEPTATVQPTPRSLLPPTSTPASPSPSASSDARSDGGGPGAADVDPAPAAEAAPAATKPPTPTPKKPAEQPAINGQVLAAGRPVTDAQVTISGSGYHHNTTTSSQGRFQSATPPGTYTVTASSPSVSGCGARTVTVEANAVSYVTITCSG